MTDYIPVDCAFHDRLEILAMRKLPVTIRWKPPGEAVVEEVLLPEDMIIRNHEEFLLARTTRGQQISIRLDTIRSVGADFQA